MNSPIISSEICAKLVYLKQSVVEYESEYLPREGGIPQGASLKQLFLTAKDFLKLIITFFIFKYQSKK